ncbi:succinyl-CoA synthetase subunit alpha [Candidatus Gottesmanbacteria bacterium]|nr:succinyl-CoA synthetase subunit alpha [Candidatus Gottesmanbacteria bacterium]
MNIQPKTPNYDYFIKADTSAYKGEWVAITNKRIIAHGTDAQKVYQTAKQKSKTGKVSLAKIPDEQLMVLPFSPS